MKGKVFFTKIHINYFLSTFHPSGIKPVPRFAGNADGQVIEP